MNKKGTEMGLNTIVMAIIAIAVLVVVIIVFANKFGMFSSVANDCEGTGKGTCIDTSADCTAKYQGRLLDYKCKESGKFCCVGACTLAGGTCGGTCSEDRLIYAFCGSGSCCRPSTVSK
jgi:hypothetical protein